MSLVSDMVMNDEDINKIFVDFNQAGEA